MTALLHSRFADTLGWTLLHSLWQLALLAAVCAAALAALRRVPAGVRYALACATLLLMLAAPLATYAWLLPPAPAAQSAALELPREVTLTPAPAPAFTAVDTPLAPAPPRAPLPLNTRIKLALAPWLPAAVCAYLLGAALMLARLMLGYARLRRLIAHATQLEGRALAQLHTLAKRMHIHQTIRLLQSAAIEVPTLIGTLKPVILLPAAALTGLSPEQLAALLAHELAHIRRHDYLLNLAQSLIDTLLFYHPAAWWLSSRIRHERELCCDDAAIAATADRLAYARALAAMESLRTPGTFALAAGGGSLLTRVRRILSPAPRAPRPLPRRVLSASAALLLITAAALAYLGCNRSAPAPASPATTPAATLAANQTSHTYDIRYLLGPSTDPAQTKVAVQTLLDTIQSSVAPDSWKSHGGTGELTESEGKLTITQTPENLTAVNRLLAQLFESRALAINVEFRALLVSNNFLDDFRVGWSLNLPIKGMRPPGTGNNASLIDNWTLNLLLTATQADKRTLTLTAPRVTTPNGYPIQLSLNAHQPDAAEGTPLIAEGDLASISLGTTPVLSADRRYVVFKDFVLALGRTVVPSAPTTAGTSPALAGAYVQLPHVATAPASTMFSLPDGGTLLVNGGAVQLAGESKPSHTLLLLVRPNMAHNVAEAQPVLFLAAGGMPLEDSAATPPQPDAANVLIKATLIEADAEAFAKASNLPATQPGGTLLTVDPSTAPWLQDLIAAKKAEVLSRPHVLVKDGQNAQITVGQQLNYIKDIHLDADHKRAADIDTLTTGIIISLTPYVRNIPASGPNDHTPAEPGTIALNVDATVTELVRMDTKPGPKASAGPASATRPAETPATNALPDELPIQIPVLDRRQAIATLRLHPDQTAVLTLLPAKPGKIDLIFLTPHIALDAPGATTAP